MKTESRPRPWVPDVFRRRNTGCTDHRGSARRVVGSPCPRPAFRPLKRSGTRATRGVLAVRSGRAARGARARGDSNLGPAARGPQSGDAVAKRPRLRSVRLRRAEHPLYARTAACRATGGRVPRRGSKRTRVPWFARSWRFEPRACGPRSAIWRRGREAPAAPFRAASPHGTPPVRENRGVPRDRRSRATPRFEADRGRFELPIRGNPYTAFPMLLLQPLGHLSGCEDGRLV